MPTSHAEKSQARAYATQHGCSYTTALRVIRDVNDPLSFRRFLEQLPRTAETAAVIELLRTDHKMPAGRDYETTFSYQPFIDACASDGGLHRLHNWYRSYLYRFGVIGHILVNGAMTKRLGTMLTQSVAPDAWREVAFDPSFPTGDDAQGINRYLDEIDASEDYRTVVAAQWDNRWLSIARSEGENPDGRVIQRVNLGDLESVPVYRVGELPDFIRCRSHTVVHGWASIGSDDLVTGFTDGHRPQGRTRPAVLAGWVGRPAELFTADPIVWSVQRTLDLEYLAQLGAKADAMNAALAISTDGN